MRKVDIREAKAHLARLVEQAAAGEPFIIARAGRPMVVVTRVAAPAAPQRIGCMAGEIAVPDDFDRMGRTGIAGLFGEGA
jgi:prevent-host-death family protein